VRTEVVHEQIVCVVDKEVKGVNHFSVVSNQWHLDCLLHDLRYGLFCALLFLQELNLHLLLRFFQQKFGFSNDLFTLFQILFNHVSLLQDANIVSVLKLFLLLLEKLRTVVSLLVKFFSFKLDVYEVCIF